jgi:hypothetical protein
VVNVRPIHGLIFLFHWKQEPNEEEVELSCRENLWFANQVIDNLCASLALLSIILNVPDLDVGDHLSQFREFTKDFSPPLKSSRIAKSGRTAIRSATVSVSGDTAAEIGRTARCDYHSCWERAHHP